MTARRPRPAPAPGALS